MFITWSPIVDFSHSCFADEVTLITTRRVPQTSTEGGGENQTDKVDQNACSYIVVYLASHVQRWWRNHHNNRMGSTVSCFVSWLWWVCANSVTVLEYSMCWLSSLHCLLTSSLSKIWFYKRYIIISVVVINYWSNLVAFWNKFMWIWRFYKIMKKNY